MKENNVNFENSCEKGNLLKVRFHGQTYHQKKVISRKQTTINRKIKDKNT